MINLWKKAHWITIILLGIISLFFLVQSVLAKQEADMHKEIAIKATELNAKLEEEKRLQELNFELLKVKYEHDIDSLKQLIKEN